MDWLLFFDVDRGDDPCLRSGSPILRRARAYGPVCYQDSVRRALLGFGRVGFLRQNRINVAVHRMVFA